MSNSNGVAVTTASNEVQTFKMNSLPDLSKAEILPLDLMSDYWTPTKEGESKRLFFDRIGTRNVKDEKTGEVFELECAYFVEVVDGEPTTISNGSKRLLGAIENNDIQHGTPLLITYKGKKKNSTNAFQSDHWSVKPLFLNL
jgi:hypothetical protein